MDFKRKGVAALAKRKIEMSDRKRLCGTFGLVSEYLENTERKKKNSLPDRDSRFDLTSPH